MALTHLDPEIRYMQNLKRRSFLLKSCVSDFVHIGNFQAGHPCR